MTNAPIFILLNPQLGENIGAVARAMSNFGLSDLRIVAPRDGWPNPAANAMAAHGEYLLEKAMVVATLKDALTNITTLYATTPRTDVLNKPVLTPRAAMEKLSKIPPLAGGYRGEASDDKTASPPSPPQVGGLINDPPVNRGGKYKTAILFGPERAGLSNEDIVLADAIISIPVTEENPSLNIAQAAVVIAYEWFLQSPPLATTSLSLPSPSRGRVREGAAGATKSELEGLFEHAKEVLDEVNYFREPNKTKLMWQHLRSIWVKSNLTSQEVRTLRGMLRALKRKMRDD